MAEAVLGVLVLAEVSPAVERRAELVDVDAPDDARRAHGRVVHEERERGLGRTREIQRRFNVSVPRARVPEKASTLRDRSER